MPIDPTTGIHAGERTVINDTEAQMGGDVECAWVELREQAAAPTLPTDKVSALLYSLTTDHRVYLKTSAGATLDLTLAGTAPLTFKGTIATAANFPTAALVESGWVYRVTADVTDNDPTKTNTGLSFLAGAEIAWNGTTWTELGTTMGVQEVHAAGAFTLPAGSSLTFVDTATAAAGTSCTLPASSATKLGEIITVGDYTGAAATNNITIGRTGADTIDGVAANLVLNKNNVLVALECTGTGWKTIYRSAPVSSAATALPVGTAAAGTSLVCAPDDHVHGYGNQHVWSTHNAVELATLGSQIDAALNGTAGLFFHPRRAIVKLTAITNVPNGDAQITIGTTHAGTEILPATALTGLVAVHDQFIIGLTGYFAGGIASDATIHVTVTSADTGAAAVATAQVKLEGYVD